MPLLLRRLANLLVGYGDIDVQDITFDGGIDGPSFTVYFTDEAEIDEEDEDV